MMNRGAWVLVLVACMTLHACSKKTGESAETKGADSGATTVETLMSYPVTGLDGVLTQTGVAFDSTTSADGNGSLKIIADAPASVRLFETGDIDVENARVIYRARLRTEGVEGNVYLEMWCSFTGKGEFFSRALQAPLTGTVEWTSQETPFFLKTGENPDNIKLNVVIDGKGTVWVDAIELIKGPLGDT